MIFASFLYFSRGQMLSSCNVGTACSLSLHHHSLRQPHGRWGELIACFRLCFPLPAWSLQPCGSFPRVLFPVFPIFRLSNLARVTAKCANCNAEYWCNPGCLLRLWYQSILACWLCSLEADVTFIENWITNILKPFFLLLLFRPNLIKVDRALANASAGKHLI